MIIAERTVSLSSLLLQALYDKEMEKIFGRFETRGMTVQREAWGSYVTFLKSRQT